MKGDHSMLAAIWAQDESGLIGKDAQLPWYLPADLRYFKEKTLHHTIVMGRKTFEGMGGRPLPHRKTIVLTRDENYQNEQVLVMHSKEDVLSYAEQQEDIVWITGGSLIYREFIPYCDELYRTVIEGNFQGDTYFPEIDWHDWKLVDSQSGIIDEKNSYSHRFERYQKIT